MQRVNQDEAGPELGGAPLRQLSEIVQVSVAPGFGGTHGIQLHGEAPLARLRYHRTGCFRTRVRYARPAWAARSGRIIGHRHSRFATALLKRGQDRGQGLSWDLDALVPPVLVTSGNPGILGATDQLWVGHSPIIGRTRTGIAAGPADRP